MSIEKITSNDLTGIGVIGLEDAPGLSKDDMQAKFEETARGVIIPRLNSLITEFNQLCEDVKGLALDAGQVTASQISAWDAKSNYNPNLLHNADWAYSLINQRGHSGAVSSAYCIDRWMGNGTVTPVSGQHVTLEADTTMTQRMEIIPAVLAGRACVFSIDIDGEVESVNISFPAAAGNPPNTVEMNGCTVRLGFTGEAGVLCDVASEYIPYIRITAAEKINVRRVFLEYDSATGEYASGLNTASHMEQVPPLSFAESLAICQRYFININNNNLVPIGTGFMGNSVSARVLVPTPVPMRAVPTCSHSDSSKLASLAVLSDGTSFTVTAIEAVELMSNGLGLRLTVSGAVTAQGCVLRMLDSTKLYFSADL